MCGQQAFLCSICFKPIRLTQCTFDEDGRPVHEQCYVDRLLHSPKPPRSAAFWGELRTKLSRITHRK